MFDYIPIREYRVKRSKILRLLGGFFKILSKINRDWVFSMSLRNRLYRMMGVNISTRSYVARETWIDDNFPELITIEEGVVIGWRSSIIAHNTQMMPPSVAPICIKKHAFLGQGVIVMPGVTIGEYAQIGTCSLVNKDIEPYTVAVGVPAKPIRKLTQDEIDLRNSTKYLG